MTATCVNGHSWTPETTYRHPRGGRVCRVCRRLAQRRYRDQQRGTPTTCVYGPVADRIVAALVTHPNGLVGAATIRAKMGYRSSVGSIRRTIYDLRHKKGVPIESVRVGQRVHRYVLREQAA